MTATLDALLKRATPGPYQVSGARGKIISGHRTYDYHGIGPDGLEIAAVWFDTRTGAGFMDAKALVAAFNAAPAHLQRIRDLEEALRPFADAHGTVAALDHSDERWPDESTLDCEDNVGFAECIQIGHLRRARQLLESPKP